MNLFLDFLWIWVVLAFIAAVGGYTFYAHNPRKRHLTIAVVVPILTLCLGASLYYGIDTDRKAITRTLDSLLEAIESDDIEAVCRFISPKAEDIRYDARKNMRTISISRARYNNLEIEVNDAASPPIAYVRFSSVFYWRTKLPIHSFSVDQPIPQSGRFELEWVKTKDHTWTLTKYVYSPMRTF